MTFVLATYSYISAICINV